MLFLWRDDIVFFKATPVSVWTLQGIQQTTNTGMVLWCQFLMSLMFWKYTSHSFFYFLYLSFCWFCNCDCSDSVFLPFNPCLWKKLFSLISASLCPPSCSTITPLQSSYRGSFLFFLAANPTLKKKVQTWTNTDFTKKKCVESDVFKNTNFPASSSQNNIEQLTMAEKSQTWISARK